MTSPEPEDARSLEARTFLWLLVLVTLAFVCIVVQFYGAILWGTAAALVFAPLYRRLAGTFRGRTALAAIATVSIILALVVLPLVAVGAMLVQEVAGFYKGMQSGELSVARNIQKILDVLPSWATALLERFGLDQRGALQERLAVAINKSSQQLATHALNFGQNIFSIAVEFFVMLYLLFFLLRDGSALAEQARRAIPLRQDHMRALSDKFTTVIRATVKGNIVVATIQGTLGGLAFLFLGLHAPVLWGVVMAFFSLVPAVGAALVWLPAALYLIVTGATLKGAILIAYGLLVIGLVDNFLRPILVGKDTLLPDYVVLISTLGGMTLFGINGFVVGPLVAGMFIAVWHILTEERNAASD